jgi:serine/threonine protein kinase
LHAVLGEGATSVVWSATGPGGESVAVKVPRPGAAGSPTELDLEKYVHNAVRHDHLVPLRGTVTLADGRVALVFDLVEGASLRSVVNARGRLRPGEVVTTLTPICQAVAALHAAGGNHGDISAGNIMLTETGRPVLLDLGAAHVVGGSGGVFGTKGFVAPEIREGRAHTSASDVFSLGAVAWFSLTGNGAPDTNQRLDRETITSHVGRELSDVVAACIDPSPDRRPDAARLARMVYESARPEPVEVVVGADEASALTHRLRADAALQAPPPAGRPRHSARWLVALAALAAVIVGSAGWIVLGPRPAAADREVATPSTTLTPTSAGATTSPRPTAVQHDDAAPRSRTLELVQWLSDERAHILVSGDVKGLSTIHRPGSPSHRSDTQLLRTLADGGNRYADLRLEVAEAVWLRGSPGEATVRARVDWSTYVVLNGSGERTARPAASGRPLDFTLVKDADGWRIASISVPPST